LVYGHEWTNEHQFSQQAKENHRNQLQELLSDPSAFQEQLTRWRASLDAEERRQRAELAAAPGIPLTPEEMAQREVQQIKDAMAIAKARGVELAPPETPEGRKAALDFLAAELARIRAADRAAPQALTFEGRVTPWQKWAVSDFLEQELEAWYQANRALAGRYDDCQTRLELAVIDGCVHAAALLPSKRWRYLSASECAQFEAPWRDRQVVDGMPAWTLIAEADIATAFRREGDKSRAGRPPQPFWSEVEKQAFEWLDENGSPIAGSGEQAEFERHVADILSAKGHYPAESSVREHCRGWIEAFEAQRRGQ
jgi:hypothetical protein